MSETISKNAITLKGSAKLVTDYLSKLYFIGYSVNYFVQQWNTYGFFPLSDYLMTIRHMMNTNVIKNLRTSSTGTSLRFLLKILYFLT